MSNRLHEIAVEGRQETVAWLAERIRAGEDAERIVRDAMNWQTRRLASMLSEGAAAASRNGRSRHMVNHARDMANAVRAMVD